MRPFHSCLYQWFLLPVVIFLLSSCHTYYLVSKCDNAQVRMSGEAGIGDSLTETIIAPYRRSVEADLSMVIGVTEGSLEKGQPEGALGNFVTDACLLKANDYFQAGNAIKPDFCFLNNGGLRTALPKGNITKQKIFELMPFENELVCIMIHGSDLKKLFDMMSAKDGMPVSNASYAIAGKKSANVLVGGMPVDTSRIYSVLTSDYLAAGGDGLNTLQKITLQKKLLNIKVRDAIIQYISDEHAKGHIIKIPAGGRITKQP